MKDFGLKCDELRDLNTKTKRANGCSICLLNRWSTRSKIAASPVTLCAHRIQIRPQIRPINCFHYIKLYVQSYNHSLIIKNGMCSKNNVKVEVKMIWKRIITKKIHDETSITESSGRWRVEEVGLSIWRLKTEAKTGAEFSGIGVRVSKVENRRKIWRNRERAGERRQSMKDGY